MPVSVNGKPADGGCYIDGHWGQYGSSLLIRIADDFLGTTYWEEASAAEWAEKGMACDELAICEELGWMADDAETALNDATIGGCWEWHNGEFFLREDVECSVDGCDNFADFEHDGRCDSHDLT